MSAAPEELPEGPLRGYGFTLAVAASVAVALLRPGWFNGSAYFDIRTRWIFLAVVQAVMFGMGTQMTLRDFEQVGRAPRGVLVGILCHFSIMPLVGLALARLFGFEPEIAAGVILIGCCSSGLSSNVMAFLARANLALSVTVTAVTTLIAPVMTPLLMKLLAGRLVEIRFFDMMMQIIEIVIVPIFAALLHDVLRRAPPAGRRAWLGAAALGAAWLAGAEYWRMNHAGGTPPGTGFLAANLAAEALTVGTAYHFLVRAWPRIERAMPGVAMAGVCYFTVVTTAEGRDNLIRVGLWLVLASVLHNSAGYFFGYWLSRGAGLDRNSARSVAFEVGLQNGAMASGLAAGMGKIATMGLAPAIFSPWMNISGSMLANFWRRRPVEEGEAP